MASEHCVASLPQLLERNPGALVSDPAQTLSQAILDLDDEV